MKTVVGRAIYADGGTATINGTISNIKSDADMWNGCQGVAIHLRNCATASVGGTIQNVKSTDNNSVVVWCEMSSFILEKGRLSMTVKERTSMVPLSILLQTTMKNKKRIFILPLH